MLRAMRGDMAALNGKVDRVASDLSAVKTEQRSHSRTLNILVQEVGAIRQAIDFTSSYFQLMFLNITNFPSQFVKA